MIHYQLIGAVRDPYISKYEVEIRRERLEAIKSRNAGIIIKYLGICYFYPRALSDVLG